MMRRRSFLKATAQVSALAGLGDLGFLAQLPPVSATEARLDPKLVRLQPEIEPLVRLLETTSRERLLEEVAFRIKHGTTYREVLAALLLAGVRNIQPRPVGFKFHAVLVCNLYAFGQPVLTGRTIAGCRSSGRSDQFKSSASSQYPRG